MSDYEYVRELQAQLAEAIARAYAAEEYLASANARLDRLAGIETQLAEARALLDSVRKLADDSLDQRHGPGGCGIYAQELYRVLAANPECEARSAPRGPMVDIDDPDPFPEAPHVYHSRPGSDVFVLDEPSRAAAGHGQLIHGEWVPPPEHERRAAAERAVLDACAEAGITVDRATLYPSEARRIALAVLALRAVKP